MSLRHARRDSAEPCIVVTYRDCSSVMGVSRSKSSIPSVPCKPPQFVVFQARSPLLFKTRLSLKSGFVNQLTNPRTTGTLVLKKVTSCMYMLNPSIWQCLFQNRKTFCKAKVGILTVIGVRSSCDIIARKLDFACSRNDANHNNQRV